MKLFFFWWAYITISGLICQYFFVHFSFYFCFILVLRVVFLCFLLIIVIIQNIRSCNKKGSFLQKSKWVFKKGFLQDVRHNLWEISPEWRHHSRLRQPNSGKIYCKMERRLRKCFFKQVLGNIGFFWRTHRIEKRNETVFLSAMRLLHEKKNRMCAMLICHFVFPSYATTSPMRIATIHSVHLPLFLDFVGIYFIPTGHSNCFYTKNQFLFCYLPDFFKFLSISLHSCHFSVGK